MSLTGNKETDFLVLMELNDEELGKVCQVNKYVNKLCNDDNFYRKRIYLNYKYSPQIANSMKNYLAFDTWKEYYIWLSFLSEEERNLIVTSLETDKIQIIDAAVTKLKTLTLPKWIYPPEFYKTFKRDAFINIHPEINIDYEYDEEENNAIDYVAWKCYKSLCNYDLLEIFFYEWFPLANRN
jgi:hypothetical protein